MISKDKIGRACELMCKKELEHLSDALLFLLIHINIIFIIYQICVSHKSA